MEQIYVDEGLVFQLDLIVAVDNVWHIFVNDVTPDRDTELGDLTEASFSGYAEQTVLGTAFIADGVVGHVGFKVAAPIAFLNSSGSPVDVYGYYVTDAGGTILLAAARFDAAPVTKEDGESIIVVPVWGAFSQAF